MSNALGELMQKIPGYGGYIKREKIRDEDKALRMSIADAFASQVTRITRVQEQMLKRGDLESLEALDGVIGRLQHLVDRIRTATYGFEGWSLYDKTPIDEQVLEALYNYDLKLSQGVEEMADIIAQMGATTSAADQIERLRAKIDDLHSTFDGRSAVIDNPSTASIPANDPDLNDIASDPAGNYPPTVETPVSPESAAGTSDLNVDDNNS